MDSGATQVAYYGGFGMPTVVLLGGTDRRVMFSTLSFSTADTTQMRDSIMALLESLSAITNLPSTVSSFNVFPNPANNNVSVNLDLKETANLMLDIMSTVTIIEDALMIAMSGAMIVSIL